MFKNQGIVQPLDGKAHETEAVTGGLEPLNPGGQPPVVAVDGLGADAADATAAAVSAPESDLEVAMSALGALPEDQVAGLKTVAATSSSSVSEAESDVFSSDTQIRQALGIHQTSVGSTDFLDRATGDDFGMTEFLESGSFSATPGADLAGRGIEDEVEWEGLAWFRTSPEDDSLLVLGTVDLGDMDEDGSMLITMAGLLAKAYNPADAPLVVTDLRLADGSGVLTDNGDGTWTFTPAADWNGNVVLSYLVSDGETSSAAKAALTVNPVNDAPVIAVNDVLLVDDLTAQSLAGSLSATDVDNDAADLLYTITQGPVSGVLLLDGVEITDFSQPVFTQADIDGGRVSFSFDTPQPGDEFRVIEDDSFVFTVDDGSLSTVETTFSIRNSAVQIWGTDEADDLTGAADFSREGVTFHVFGFDGNDTLRGGAGSDTLDGGGQTYASHTPWLYTQEGGDTVDYTASTAAVDIDLTRATQAGGHAEGDVLIGIENVIGSGFNDSITGDAAANFLSGLDGTDTLLGGVGNDTLRGGAGADLIDGGAGQDFADYRTSASWVNVDLNIQDGTTAQSGGGADNDAEGDTLIGIENLIGSNDATHGDVLTGNAANNHLIGLDGDDTLIGGAGNDTLVSGAGADRVDGGTGTRDLADYSASTAWVNVDLNIQNGTTAQTGGGAGNHAEGDILTGIEDVNGSQYSDSLTGNGGSNRIWAYDGDDTIFGGGFYDTIHGGDGNDSIDGGTHEDFIYGDAGNDTLHGGGGIDSIWGGAGDDYLYGGSDNTQDLLIGGTGNDTLEGGSATLLDTLIGGMGADRIIGNGIRSSASYELTGYGDFDVSYQGVYLDLRLQGLDADGNLMVQPGKPGGDDATGDILTGIVNAVGTNGSDTLIGNDQANEMFGVDGDDLMIGGAGNDKLEGVNNNDTLEGGLGADYIWGGMDYDIASYANAASGVNVSLEIQKGGLQSGAGEENGDELWYMDGLWGSEFNDTLTGSTVEQPEYLSAQNLLQGGAGDDVLAGLGGNDTLDGGDGIDTADYSLSEASVLVDLNLTTAQTGGGDVTTALYWFDAYTSGTRYGGNHAQGDMLVSIENVTGSAYGDTLIGDGGNNVLSGLDGADSLVGGDGSDTADYSLSTSAVNVDLTLTTSQTGGEAGNHAEGDVLTGMENVTGSAHADTLVGDAGVNILDGLGGDDVIIAGAGDTVLGGAGSDVLYSGDASLDISASTTISGVERIDLTGTAGSLTVSGDAILYNAALDPAGSGNMALVVNGDAGDVLHIGYAVWNWATIDEGFALGDGKTYTVYEAESGGETVKLYLESGMVLGGGETAPVMADFAVTTDEDTALAFQSGDFTADGRYADDHSFEPALVKITGLPDHGTLYLGAEAVMEGDTITYADLGGLRMVPGGDFFGDTSFTIKVSDGLRWSDEATVTVQVSPVNDAPVVDLNTQLIADDTASVSLTGSLHAADVDNDAADLSYSIDQAPVHGVLLLDGVEITDFSQPVFTQDDIDNGRVAFQFTASAGAEAQVVTGDSFTFTVSDGAATTALHTFDIHNSVVQVWGTDNADDLTALTNFDDDTSTFHVYGFVGNDILRGGVNADTLDGGLGTDTVDYSASAAWVQADLNLATAQIGGGAGNDALGDVLAGIENLTGSSWDDSLTGDGQANVLTGLAGIDTLIGGAGNDTLIGGAGVDSMDGGTGTDMGDYSGGASWVQVNLTLATAQVGGGADNDALGDTLAGIENLTGTTDTAHGDVLTGNTLANLLIGLDGDDTLIGGSGNDTLIGGVGADSLDGGLHSDMVDYSASASWVNVNLNLATAQLGGGDGNHALGDTLAGIENLTGTNDIAHGDVLTGNNLSNLLSGLDGDDTIYGGGFYDTIYGGDGNDSIDGGTHEDAIYGGTGNDTLHGGGGIDSIRGGAGDDYLYGGADNIQDLLIGGTGNDTLEGGSATLWDTLVGGMGADRIIGNGVRSSASYELTGHGDYDVNWQGVYLDLRLQGLDADGNLMVQPGKPGGDDATGDILTGIVNAVGTNGADTLIGNDQNNEMLGQDADDLMIGGVGNDSLWGVNNNDTLEGGLGEDLIWGGMDYDIASYANAASGVNVSLEIQNYDADGNYSRQSGAGEENGDSLWYMDGLWGSEFNDTLTGRSTDIPDYMSVHNLIEGRGGDDILAGLSGNDTLDGGTGSDTANYSLSTSAVNVDLALSTAQTGGEVGNHAAGDVLISIENVTGSAYGDTLTGDGGNNVLSGLAGDDSLIGGGGDDTLIGGAGSDTFQGGDGDDLIRAGAGDVVDGGVGSDVLVSEDEYLDVTSSTTITGIERIDLTGAGKDLAVNGDAILLNGVADPAGSGFMALVVNGDDGDSVIRVADGWSWTLVASDMTVGGDGLTYALYEASKAGQTVRLYMETGLNEIELADGVYHVLGTEGHDDLTTVWDFTDSRHPFNIQGLGGDDTLLGGPGDDTLAGGAGSDLMDGGAGYDMASYSTSASWVDMDLNLQDGVTAQSGGGAANHAAGDTLIGFEGVIGSNDAAHGDVLTGDDQANMLVGLDGDDSLVGGAGNDTLVGGLGYDTLEGGDGDDWFQDGVGSYDNTYTGDYLVGGAGIDTVDYSNSLDVCMVDLTDSWYSFPNSSYSDAYCDTLVGIENIIGSQWFDSLLGDGGANMIDGGGYWDYILGRGGDDTLLGGSDNDTLDGGAGNDFMDGGADNDLLIGGAGIDTIQGGTGDDLIHGGADDVVDGGDGFDTFRLEDNIGTGSAFDLGAMNDAGRITGIERIDITGDADDANTLTLRAEDVFEVSGGSLYIDGDTGDSVTTMGEGWTQEAADVSHEGQTYHHYTAQYDSQTINLYVETTLAYQNEI
ncbi:tandem-95 repeat protein [Desulfomicrobium baculatum]|uniref:Hemolysin-type calcium-binding region n=1 Tax=Desulfomicrobium baculatum (strain DSM 4028 / VKM B-1378 / X) TaxID=525897 RepID=C7LX99_DESBD|nr:tandem-95 repeat protein [Desulfomicrobium baculatum]ACU89970.1 Hemolysin-type calcium-binding region [Desulfomicrobium baculatum DSM 4028]